MKKLSLYIPFEPRTLQVGEELQDMNRVRIYRVAKIEDDQVRLSRPGVPDSWVDVADMDNFRRLTLVDVAEFDGGDLPSAHVGNHPMVTVDAFNRMAKERDGAFDEVHKLRNQLQAIISREHGFRIQLGNRLPQFQDSAPLTGAQFERMRANAEKKWLEEDRACAAEQAVQFFDFDPTGWSYVDGGGWTVDGDNHIATLFMLPLVDGKRAEGDSTKKSFVVRFKAGSDEIESTDLQ